MKIRCGVPTYANGVPVGTILGFRVDAVEDRITAIVVRPNEPNATCCELDFRRVVSADNNGLWANAFPDEMAKATEQHCEQEHERLDHWLQSLVPDVDDAEEAGYRYVVYSAIDRGTFTLSGSRDISMGRCGCGMFESAVVDTQGYIDHLTLILDNNTGATVYMRPLAKRYRDELRGQAAAVGFRA